MVKKRKIAKWRKAPKGKFGTEPPFHHYHTKKEVLEEVISSMGWNAKYPKWTKRKLSMELTKHFKRKK